MQQVELKVIAREAGQKSTLGKLRIQGFVPGNIYGPGLTNQICAFSEKEMRKVFKGDFNSNFMLNLISDASQLNGKKVILKNVERDPLTWHLTHADFYEVTMTRPIVLQLPLHFVGTPEDVKQGTGILQVIRRTIRVRALPMDIPEYLEVDIAGLIMGKGLHISDLKVSDKIKIMDSADFAVVSVTEPEKEEVVETVAAATPEGGEAAAAATGDAAKAGDAKAAAGKDAGAAKDAGKDAKAAAKPAKA